MASQRCQFCEDSMKILDEIADELEDHVKKWRACPNYWIEMERIIQQLQHRVNFIRRERK